ncbi:MAG: flagellar assembly protein FliW [Clostridia bacterium]
MKCNTRDFGEVEYNESDVIKFVQAPFGFEEFTDYIMILNEEQPNFISWLQSTTNPNLCFILVNTFDIYSPEIPEEVTQAIGDGTTSIFGICVITQDIKKSTINLKSPIFINEDTQTATQFILSKNYAIKHLLFDEGE